MKELTIWSFAASQRILPMVMVLIEGQVEVKLLNKDKRDLNRGRNRGKRLGGARVAKREEERSDLGERKVPFIISQIGSDDASLQIVGFVERVS